MNWHEHNADGTVQYSLYAAKERFRKVYVKECSPQAYNNWIALSALYLGKVSLEPNIVECD